MSKNFYKNLILVVLGVPSLVFMSFSLQIKWTNLALAHKTPEDCSGSGLGINLYKDKQQVHIGDTISYSVEVFNGAGSGAPVVCDASDIQASLVTPDGISHSISLRRTSLSNIDLDSYPNVVSYTSRNQDVKAGDVLSATASVAGSIHQNDTDSRGGSNQAVNTTVLPDCDAGPNLSYDQAVDAIASGKLIVNFSQNSANSRVTATITNNAGCSVPVSFASYKMFEPYSLATLSRQVFFDGTPTANISPSSTQTLSVGLPSCAAQYDLWYGDFLRVQVDNQPYGKFLAGNQVAQNNFCAIVPPVSGSSNTSVSVPPASGSNNTSVLVPNSSGSSNTSLSVPPASSSSNTSLVVPSVSGSGNTSIPPGSGSHNTSVVVPSASGSSNTSIPPASGSSNTSLNIPSASGSSNTSLAIPLSSGSNNTSLVIPPASGSNNTSIIIPPASGSSNSPLNIPPASGSGNNSLVVPPASGSSNTSLNIPPASGSNNTSVVVPPASGSGPTGGGPLIPPASGGGPLVVPPPSGSTSGGAPLAIASGGPLITSPQFPSAGIVPIFPKTGFGPGGSNNFLNIAMLYFSLILPVFVYVSAKRNRATNGF